MVRVRAQRVPWLLFGLLGPGCLGQSELFVALEGASGGQWILIEGDGASARVTALDPGVGSLRASEDARLRALVYEEVALPSPLPAFALEGAPLPTPSAFLELVSETDGFGWRARALSTLELRLEVPSPCAETEFEALISLPLLDPKDEHKSSLLLRDGRLLIGGIQHLFIVDGMEALRSSWTSTAPDSGGPRALSEASDGLWFESSNETFFSPLAPGQDIRAERRRILEPETADFVYTTPADGDRLLLVNESGLVFEYTPSSGPRPLFQTFPGAQVARLGSGEVVVAAGGEVEPRTIASFARYRDGVLRDDAPFGAELTSKIKIVVNADDYFVGAEGGLVAFDRGQGWQRADLETGSLGRVRGFAKTPRGYLVGSKAGELVEHIWGLGNCPPASFEATTIEAIHALGDDRYVIVPEELSDGLRIFRLIAP